jgi:short-subunit dehydrogenase
LGVTVAEVVTELVREHPRRRPRDEDHVSHAASSSIAPVHTTPSEGRGVDVGQRVDDEHVHAARCRVLPERIAVVARDEARVTGIERHDRRDRERDPRLREDAIRELDAQIEIRPARAVYGMDRERKSPRLGCVRDRREQEASGGCEACCVHLPERSADASCLRPVARSRYAIVMQNEGKTALITGASAGIGRDLARVFAREGFDLVLVARREDRLREVQRALEAAHGIRVTVLVADLALPEAPKAIFDATEGRGQRIDVLVNNAGYTLPGAYTAVPWQKQEALIRVLVTSVAELCHRFLPLMLARGHGRVMNVASLAGLLPGAPGGTLYAGAKSFVVKMTESIAAEIAGKNVSVLALCPGFTMSEFHDVAGTREKVSAMPKWMWMDGPTVAEEGYRALMRGDVVFVNGVANRGIARVVSLLPPRMARSFMASQRRNVD